VAALEGLDVESARRIGARARERILDEHTYAHRARQFEDVLSTHQVGAPR
jgi:spore maturation protein CgeB